MGGKGMEEEARVHLRGMLLEIQADQRRLHEAEASRNELEALLAEMRAALQGRLGHAELMQADATRVILDDTQTWLDEQDTLDTSVTATDAILARTQNVQAQLRELNKAFFDRLKAEKEASTAGLESEAARRRAEEAVADKDDHDTRPLKFEDRIRMAENNKKEGNELFRDGNLMHSLERYSKALGHCFKVVGDLTPKQHVRLLDCKGSLSLNLAQCYYKLGKWHKAVDSCSDVVKYLNSSSSTAYNADPDQDGVTQVESEAEGPELTANWANVRLKAMLRRGLAHEKLNMTDHQLSDAQAVLDVDADNASALGLLARAQAKRAAHMKAEKAMARKMFG
jgi:tetratricopeptide (TPR) repeat protein